MVSEPVERGQVWWVDLGVPIGSAPGFQRPAVVISSNRFNASRLNTVTVAAVTSNLAHAAATGNVRLPDDLLAKPSVVNVTQLVALDRSQLVEHLADLPAQERHVLDEGLRLALDL